LKIAALNKYFLYKKSMR